MIMKIIILLLLFFKTIKSLKICFHENTLNERGTSIAIYDYADYAEKLLGHLSHIIVPSVKASSFDNSAYIKFKNRFNVTLYDGPVGGHELPKHAISQGCNLLYLIKAGLKGSFPPFPDAFSSDLPTVVHAVFHWEPHGNAYAAISPEVHPQHDNNFVIPHMVRKPHVTATNSLRTELGIPTSALTVCRHGGYETFSLPIAVDAVKSLVGKFDATKLHFIFLNTPNFDNSPQLHFLKGTADIVKKEEFFSACDAMLHARSDGETFGLAVAEFSIRNKPVITAILPGQPAFHAQVLNSTGFYYKTKEDIISIISGFVEKGIPEKDYNAYKDFSPEMVMNKFKKIFIDPLFKDEVQSNIIATNIQERVTNNSISHHHGKLDLRNSDIRIKGNDTITLSSQNGNPIDRYILESIMNNIKFKGTFVEFGCADGITNSNTWPLEQLGWFGLCIEANIYEYDQAKVNRAHAVNKLITTEVEKYTYAMMSGHCQQLSGIYQFYSPEYLKLYNECKQEGLVKEVEIEGTPLSDILESFKMETVTYISTDCEGCEFEFIKNFNFTKYDVQVFNYEDNSVAKPHKVEIDKILNSHGFKVVFEGGDRLFVRKSMVFKYNT